MLLDLTSLAAGDERGSDEHEDGQAEDVNFCLVVTGVNEGPLSATRIARAMHQLSSKARVRNQYWSD